MTKFKLNRWIKALKSGDFKQAHNELTNRNEGFCCMGVLCEIEGLPKKSSNYKFPCKDECNKVWHHFVPPAGWLGLTGEQINKLAKLNDHWDWTLPQIARWIQKNIKPTRTNARTI